MAVLSSPCCLGSHWNIVLKTFREMCVFGFGTACSCRRRPVRLLLIRRLYRSSEMEWQELAVVIMGRDFTNIMGWPGMGGQRILKLVLGLTTFTGGGRWQVFPNTADGLKAAAQSSYQWDRCLACTTPAVRGDLFHCLFWCCLRAFFKSFYSCPCC